MTPDQALRELLDVSEDVVAAVVLGREGEIVASSIAEEPARRVADAGRAMLAYADALRRDASVARIEAAAERGAVLVLRDGDRAVVAATGSDPTAGLVYHDLDACLRNSAAGPRNTEARAAS